VLSQEEPAIKAEHFMVDLPVEGRTPRGGIITAPIAGEIVDVGQGDPVVTGRRSFGQEDPQLVGNETRQAEQQRPGGGIGWLVLAALALLA
jgi:hypothetical protein